MKNGIMDEKKIYEAVRKAVEEVGIEAIKKGPFFGIGEYHKIPLKEAA